MELLACICALQWVRNSGPWPEVTRVQLFTDSKYVHDNLYRAAEWKKNQGRNRHGEPKENMDLWKQLLAAQTKNWNSRSFRMDTREKVADFEERRQGGKGCGSASYNR
jgi:ribonuclease HI